MRFNQLPDVDTLRRILDYNPETGELTWKVRPRDLFSKEGEFKRWNGRHAGMPALNSINSGGYRTGTIFKVNYVAHRVCWKIHTGNEPPEILDHINGDRTFNAFHNLREATFVQNVGNRFPNRDTSSKYRGASWCSRDRFWASYCAGVWLGRFQTEEEAALAYNAYAIKHYGEFAKLNRIGE